MQRLEVSVLDGRTQGLQRLNTELLIPQFKNMPLHAVNMFWDVTPYSRFGETCPLNLQGLPALMMEEDVALEH